MKRITPTEAQTEVWLASKTSDDANCAYNECATLRMRGQLDRPGLLQAFEHVCSRHEMMRATFDASGESITIHDAPRYTLHEEDWSGLFDEQKHDAYRQAVSDEGHLPFDLERGPLVRLRLQRVSENEHLLTITAHHLVIDGWSLWIMCRDLGHAYAGQELPEACSYEDYARAMSQYHAGDSGREDEAFWLNEFSDRVPVLDLPTDRPRPAIKTYVADRCDVTIDPALVSQIRKTGASAGCSLFHSMLTAFHAYLARISGQDDFVVGIPTAGQTTMSMEDLVGHCVNTMPFRWRADLGSDFLSQVKATRGHVLDVMEHQQYTFGTLLRKLAPPRDPSRPAIFSVMFNVDPEIKGEDLGFGNLDVEVIIEPRCFENFEWFVNGVITQQGSIELQCQFNTDLFDQATMRNHLEGFVAFLEACVQGNETPLAELPLMTLQQRRKVLVEWNATERNYQTDRCLHQQLSRVADQCGERTAVVFQDQQLTFEQLESKSNQMARFLQEQGVQRGDLVGLCIERSETMVVALLGILKAGAGYVPLDPAYPVDRLAYMCEQSQLKCVLTETSLLPTAESFGKPCLPWDAHAHQISQLSTRALPCENAPSDTAYVIYTSGSTGKPKGVQVPHDAVINFLHSMSETPGFSAEDSILALTTLSFDIAVLEVYLPLLMGGRVIVGDRATASDSDSLINCIERYQPTHLQATPATWRLLIEGGWSGSSLKAMCGGEPMPPDLVGPLHQRVGELWNMYGPTETTVWSTCCKISDPTETIHVGQPIANTQIYLLDPRMQPVPIGVPGEVYIGGAGVTAGYRHREDLTNERFVDHRWFNPFANYTSNKIYKTGDLAKYRHDGNIEFLRRNDKQVKVRGFRIELGEIESVLLQHPAVSRCHVIVREDVPGDSRLVAYMIPHEATQVTTTDLRNHVSQSLPHYMVPQHVVQLDRFPQTNNGKVDLNALKAPESSAIQSNAYVASETESEILLGQLWCEFLELDSISADDNFFDLGGHSLLVMKVIASVEQQTGVRLNPQDFLMNNLAGLASQIPCDQGQSLGTPPATGASLKIGFWQKLMTPFSNNS